MENIFYIIGFPSLYGGAGAELYHNIPVWEKLGVKLHFTPTQTRPSTRGLVRCRTHLPAG
ncbi:MAG: hypothetical protein RR250_06050 [Akkermansia sp.]